MKHRSFIYELLSGLILLALSSGLVFAQIDSSTDVGFPPNAIFDGSNFDSIQTNNGNLHIQIPLWSLPGRNLPLEVFYTFDVK